MRESPEKYDVVVVGSGSTGGVVASRLSECDGNRVLLLEAGPDFPDEETVPPGFVTGGRQWAHQAVPEHDWNLLSEPLPDGRRIRLWRGRLVGGSSMTNGCVAVRGAPADFVRWEECGGSTWGFEALRPLYEIVEREINVHVSRPENWQPIHHAFRDGFAELGFRAVADLNVPDAWGGVIGPVSLNRRNDIRQGTLVNYIRRARTQPTFELRANALVDRVLFSGSRVVGVRHIDGAGRSHTTEADVVVLSAGAYGSPSILLRSGIGPARELAALGIKPVVDLPVGSTLMDHGRVGVFLEAPPALADMHAPAFAVFARGDGWLASTATIDEECGICGLSFVLAAENRGGTVTLASSDPDAPPRITHRYEQSAFLPVFEVLAELLGTRPLANVRCLDQGRYGRELVTERIGTAFHPAGSCGIGAVVDEGLRVHGVEGLVVADASIFPGHVSNNPNLTSFVVGEQAARLLAGRRPERGQPGRA